MNYLNIEISFYENQTIGNCIDLGYGSELIKEIILKMRENNLDYLSKKELTKFRN
jgi:tRNA(Met) C34 N-acetyltransferase TmcA